MRKAGRAPSLPAAALACLSLFLSACPPFSEKRPPPAPPSKSRLAFFADLDGSLEDIAAGCGYKPQCYWREGHDHIEFEACGEEVLKAALFGSLAECYEDSIAALEDTASDLKLKDKPRWKPRRRRSRSRRSRSGDNSAGDPAPSENPQPATPPPAEAACPASNPPAGKKLTDMTFASRAGAIRYQYYISHCYADLEEDTGSAGTATPAIDEIRGLFSGTARSSLYLQAEAITNFDSSHSWYVYIDGSRHALRHDSSFACHGGRTHHYFRTDNNILSSTASVAIHLAYKPSGASCVFVQ